MNPQAFMNGYLSGLRNGIITLSLGVAIFGFSRTFEKQSSGMQLELYLCYHT